MKKNKLLKRLQSKLGLLVIFSTLLLAGCGLPGLSATTEETIVVGGLDTTEGQILAGLIQELIEHETDYQVDLLSNLGSAYVAHQAMLNGDADITAARYTGTDWVAVLDYTPVNDPEHVMSVLQEEFHEQFGFKYYDSYGFENSYAFMMSQEKAAELCIEIVSDLAAYQTDLNAGFDINWLGREGDGYPGFIDTYQFSFDHTYPMQLGLVYDALAAGDMDLVLGYSTDGRISSYDLFILEDDLQFFPPYETTLVANEVLFENYPDLDELLGRLSGKIDTETMQELNFRADHYLLNPNAVAKEFLEENNYFREVD